MRYSPPAASASSDYKTVTEAQFKKFHAELIALGEKAVAATKHKGKTADVISRYRALTGAARQTFFARHAAELFAAVQAKK